jgi:MerR family transcriptional regulator, heat shock protein HspR
MSMRFYGIDFVAHELDVHPSSLRRWEENGLISPELATMGKTTLRIYDEKTMRLLRHAKTRMDSGMTVAEAFAQARDEIGQEEEKCHD